MNGSVTCSLCVVRILFVCTGNICRSPMGERLTRAFLDDALGASAAAVGTSSAGTHAVVGSGMEPSSSRVLSGLGGDATGFRAQQLTDEMADVADLTLTMTRRHRRAVLKVSPRSMFRTYTLREAADLLSGVDLRALPPVGDLDERARALVAALGAQRATRRRVEREDDDVIDPMGQPGTVHQQVGEQIFGALTPLLKALCDTGAAAQRPPLVAPRRPVAQRPPVPAHRPPVPPMPVRRTAPAHRVA